MMTSQILKYMYFTKTYKPRYLENETLLFLQIKNLLIAHQGLIYGKNCFVAEVTFKLVFEAYTIDQFLKHKKQ